MQNSRIYLLLIVNVVVIYACVAFLLSLGDGPQFGLVAIAMVLSLAAPIVIIGRELGERDKRIVTKETELLAMREELTDAQTKVQEAATLDELTGAYNRQHYEDLVNRHCSIAERGDYAFSICAMKIDDFDKLVEKFGRAKGDEILLLFASVVKSALRLVDIIARVEDEKFGLVLSGASEESAILALGRMADLVGQIDVSADDPELKLAASMGVVEFGKTATLESMLADADDALASAIDEGGNRIAAYS